MKLTAKKYAQALAQVMAEGKEDPKKIAKHFMDVLNRRRQSRLLPSILSNLEIEWCKANGITRMELEYAPKFKDAVATLEKALSAKGKVMIHSKPRPELLGGYRLKIDDSMIDASLSGRLASLAAGMKK